MKISFFHVLAALLLASTQAFAVDPSWEIRSVKAGPDAQIGLSRKEIGIAWVRVENAASNHGMKVRLKAIKGADATSDSTLTVAIEDTKRARLLEVESTYQRGLESPEECSKALAGAHAAIADLGTVLFAKEHVEYSSATQYQCWVEAIALQGMLQTSIFH